MSKTKSMSKYFRDTRAELRKVVWPSRKELVTYTTVVVGTVVGIGLLLWVADSVFSQLLKTII